MRRILHDTLDEEFWEYLKPINIFSFRSSRYYVGLIRTARLAFCLDTSAMVLLTLAKPSSMLGWEVNWHSAMRMGCGMFLRRLRRLRDVLVSSSDFPRNQCLAPFLSGYIVCPRLRLGFVSVMRTHLLLFEDGLGGYRPASLCRRLMMTRWSSLSCYPECLLILKAVCRSIRSR